MKKHEYEAPKFEFQELQLVERVANVCWGAKYVWYDWNDNGIQDSNDPIHYRDKSCNDLDKKLKDLYPKYYPEENTKHTNSKEDLPFNKVFS